MKHKYQTETNPKARWNSSVLQALRKDAKSHRALVSCDRLFHQVGANTEKALALVEANLASLLLGTSKRLLFEDLKVLHGTYQERRSLTQGPSSPTPCQAGNTIKASLTDGCQASA